MDLAKIRKKSLAQSGDAVMERNVVSACFASPEQLKEIVATPDGAFSAPEDPLPRVSFPDIIAPLEGISPAAVNPYLVSSTLTPLEVILAGRSAAGCDEESILTEDTQSPLLEESSLDFLCFRVSDEVYGINIMDIKEIIKQREVTEVPRAQPFVSGILSLRGTIIPVIDLRIRLGLIKQETTGKERIIVVKNNSMLSGLLVDEVIQVVRVQFDAVESAPTVLEGIDRDFVSGIGRSDNRLIIILNLEKITDINLY